MNFVSQEMGQQAVVDAIATPKNFTAASAQPSASSSEGSPSSQPTDGQINTAQAPVQETENTGLGQIDWLPLVLSILGLGLLALAVMKATAARRKQQSIPKPAPDYANRVKTEMSAPPEPEADADALDFKVAGLDLEPEDNPAAELEISPQEARRQEYIVPEFVEFNTQVQAAATQLQDADAQDINPSLEADTQLQDDDATTLQPPQNPEEQG
ncbi:MAG: hypothetical protein AAF329_16165 [Cyanobacteria bacterium P01_A01_bin.17]